MNELTSLMRALLFLPEQASTFAPMSDRLHFFIIIATMVSSSAIGAAGLYFLIRYRRRAALLSAESTAVFGAPVWLESMFIGVPLAFFLLWFFIGFRDYVWSASPPRDSIDVYVSAKQWMWEFSYPDGPSTVDVLHVPAGRPVRLLLTSRDVIHSFFVPDFRLKRDVIPARYTELWFEAPEPGRHQVLCTEYCGLDHSVMRAEVVVLTPADFEAWRAGQPLQTPLAALGEGVAAKAGCLKCHSLDGTPYVGPSFRGLYGKQEALADGSSVHVDEAYLTESMMEPNAKLVAGFAPLMPSFIGQLSAADTAALVELIKSLRSEELAHEP